MDAVTLRVDGGDPAQPARHADHRVERPRGHDEDEVEERDHLAILLLRRVNTPHHLPPLQPQTLQPPVSQSTKMTRGKKPVAAIAEAKTFAERMGYRWQENSHPDLAYDLFIFKPGAAGIVRVRQTRYRIDPDTI